MCKIIFDIKPDRVLIYRTDVMHLVYKIIYNVECNNYIIAFLIIWAGKLINIPLKRLEFN